MALLDGFGVAQPEEHIIIVNETAEKYMPIVISPGEGGGGGVGIGGWGVGDVGWEMGFVCHSLLIFFFIFIYLFIKSTYQVEKN